MPDEKNFIDRLREDRATLIIALVALLLIIFGVFAVLGGAAVVTLRPPTDLQATVIGDDIKLTWRHSPDNPDPCIGYNVYLSTAAGQLGTLQNGEPISDNKYTIPDVRSGTYYATVRCTDINGNEDGNLNQVEVKVEILPPSGLSIVINNGAEYTNTRDVVLTLSAKNAEQCTYANEDMRWDQWESYRVEKSWKLTENTREVCEKKTVYYKCRNPGGESKTASDSIILDTLKPSVSFNVLSIKDNLVVLQIFAQDDCDKAVDCHVFAGDQQVGSVPTVPPGGVERTFTVPYGVYFLSVVCTDKAENTGAAALEINVKQPETNKTNETIATIKINDDAPTTTSLNVKLTLYARVNGEVPDACYYSSNEMGNIGPEPYTTSRSWTLDNTAPERSRTYTVCYRCEKGNKQTPRACDSIRYVVEGEGDGDGGDGGGPGDGNVPPRNLKIEIIGKRPYCIGSNCFIPVLVADREVTKWNEVDLNLSSSGATECKVWNKKMPNVDTNDDDEEDVKWDQGLTNGVVMWKLIPKIVIQQNCPPPRICEPIIVVPDGLRTVHYKCRNDKGSTGPINDSIWYDATPPSPVSDLNGEYRTQPIINNIKLTWAPAVDNSWEWAGYANKGVKLYTIERYYTLAGDSAKRVYTLDPEDYAPAQFGCAEGENWMALECTHTDFDLPPDLTTQGGQMCYDISAWDYVGWQSDKRTVCVDVPASQPIGEDPYIEYVAIYTRGIIGIGEEGEEIQTSEQIIQPIDKQQQATIFGTSTQTQVPIVLLAGSGDRLPPRILSAGDPYTNKTDVIVTVKALRADDCMLGNDAQNGVDWSNRWVGYTSDPTQYTWRLRDAEGKRTVYVKCRNSSTGAVSSVASDTIILDTTAPVIIGEPSAIYVEINTRPPDNYILVRWDGVFSDGTVDVSGIGTFVLEKYRKGVRSKGEEFWELIWTRVFDGTTTSFKDREFKAGETYKYRIYATDNAGNKNAGVYTNVVIPPKDPLLPEEDKDPPTITGIFRLENPICRPSNCHPCCVTFNFNQVNVTDRSGIKDYTVIRLRMNEEGVFVRDTVVCDKVSHLGLCQIDGRAQSGASVMYDLCACDTKGNCNSDQQTGCLRSINAVTPR